MDNPNLIAYKEYVIDIDALTYKAAWNCQVEWTDDCIFYDAETGRIVIEDEEIEFVCEQQHRITKHEYQAHVRVAEAVPRWTEEQLKHRLSYGEVG